MTQPTAYTPATEFLSFEGATPTFPGQELDSELNALQTTTDEIRANLALIQRDDGDLANESVGLDQLAADVVAALGNYDADEIAALVGETIGINTYTDDHTLTLADKGHVVEMNKATALTLTVPPNSSVAFDTDTRLDIVQYGAGQLTIAAGSGVTIRSSGGKLKLLGQYSGAALYKRGTDEWVLLGELVA